MTIEEKANDTSDIELVKRTLKEITGKPTEVIYSKLITLYSAGYADGFNSAAKKISIVMGTPTDLEELEETESNRND